MVPCDTLEIDGSVGNRFSGICVVECVPDSIEEVEEEDEEEDEN